MKRIRLWPRTRLRSLSATTILLFVVACVLGAGAAACPGVASARTVARGIADYAFTSISTTPDQQTAMLRETRYELGATYVRFFVSWAAAEPERGPLDSTSNYMTGVASAVSQARQDGLKVMITFEYVPQWASAWSSLGLESYQPNDAMSTTYLPDFQEFCQDVATLFQGRVYAYECWNEPNLWLSLFPQKTPQDKNFAAHLYVKMLRSFSAGISAVKPKALRVAGATAPAGADHPSIYNTSPQRFAAVIKATKGWSSLFDAYSHHPYVPGASPRLWPEAAPGNPDTTVTLENLGTLLKLFPKKPFFLTEYGYQTAACQSFGGQHVNQITQANYLRRAYAYVARYPQVKLLMWFDLKDDSPPAPYLGFYTGLRTAGGAAKRAWYVFAGGNHLGLSAPAAIKQGATLTLTGKLSCSSVGDVAGKPLVVQSHLPGRSWVTVKTVRSQVAGLLTSPGLYTAHLRPKASAYYRVTWLGVTTSRTRHVAVK
jgi:hypothetical protein